MPSRKLGRPNFFTLQKVGSSQLFQLSDEPAQGPSKDDCVDDDSEMMNEKLVVREVERMSCCLQKGLLSLAFLK